MVSFFTCEFSILKPYKDFWVFYYGSYYIVVLGFGMMFMDLLGLGLVIISVGLIGFFFFLSYCFCL